MRKTIFFSAVIAVMASGASAATFVSENNFLLTKQEIRANLNDIYRKSASTSDVGTIMTMGDLSVLTNTPSSFMDNAIKSVSGLLTSVTFTPTKSHEFGDFSFVAQYFTGNDPVTITVRDAQRDAPQVITFDAPAFGQNMHRLGIESLNGGTIQSVTITDSNGFKDFKNPTFSLAVPEPTSWALMLVGMGGLGASLRRRRVRFDHLGEALTAD